MLISVFGVECNKDKWTKCWVYWWIPQIQNYDLPLEILVMLG